MKSFIKISKHHLTLSVRLPYINSTALRFGISGRLFMGRLTDTMGLVSKCEHDDCNGKIIPFFDFISNIDITKIYIALINLIEEYKLGDIYLFKSYIKGIKTDSYRAIYPVMLDIDLVKRITAKTDYIDLDFLERLLKYNSQTIRIVNKANNITGYLGTIKGNKYFNGIYHYPHMRILNEYLGVPILKPHTQANLSHNTNNIIKAIYETVGF